MKKLVVLALGIVTSASYASIFYNNGGPNLANGNEMAQWTQSEDIPFTATTGYWNRLRFWTLEGGTAMSTVSITYSYDDGSGNPGTSAGDMPDLALTSHTATGRSVFGLDEYEVVVDFGTWFESGSGIFHMELLANASANPNHDRLEIYWETTDGNGSNTGRESNLSTRDNWFDNGQEHAFMLENVVPEPSSIALLGLGAVAIMRRRRK